MKERIFEQ